MRRVLQLTCMIVSLVVLGGTDCTGAELMGMVSTERPDGAVVLYDGSRTNLFLSMTGSSEINWPEVDGTLVSTRDSAALPSAKRANHLVSKLHFRDAQIHVEFMLPEEGRGNSGVYIHGNYELQIYNSFGVESVSQNDMGAIYGFSEPMANQCRRPGVWQAYDVTYRAPRRDATGTIVENGSITAWLNGVKVQDGTRVGEPRSKYHPYRHGVTPYLKRIWERQQETCTGPVFLQDHDAPVRFRNVWILPLDDCAFVYERVTSRSELKAGVNQSGGGGSTAPLIAGVFHAQSVEASGPLIAYVGTFSSPLRDVLPTQVDLPPGNGRGIHLFQVNRVTGALAQTATSRS